MRYYSDGIDGRLGFGGGLFKALLSPTLAIVKKLKKKPAPAPAPLAAQGPVAERPAWVTPAVVVVGGIAAVGLLLLIARGRR